MVEPEQKEGLVPATSMDAVSNFKMHLMWISQVASWASIVLFWFVGDRTVLLPQCFIGLFFWLWA